MLLYLGAANPAGLSAADYNVMPQLREGDVNFPLVATASAFLAVGFSRPNAQAHDELKSEFIVATKARLARRN